MLLLRAPSDQRLKTILSGLKTQDFTYQPVGATAKAELPVGYHHLVMRGRLGAPTQDIFDRAKEAARNWRAQRGSGLTVVPDGPVAVGVNVAQSAPVMGVLHAIATCRVVYVEDTPTSFAYAYGTLPSHPETGEERFCISLEDEGVFFTLTAFSNAGSLLVKASGPIAWAIQRKAGRAYIEAMQAAVR